MCLVQTGLRPRAWLKACESSSSAGSECNGSSAEACGGATEQHAPTLPGAAQVTALREHMRSLSACTERLAGQLAGAEARARELQARLEAAVARGAAQEQAGRDAEAVMRTRVSAAEVGPAPSCCHALCCTGRSAASHDRSILRVCNTHSFIPSSRAPSRMQQLREQDSLHTHADSTPCVRRSVLPCPRLLLPISQGS